MLKSVLYTCPLFLLLFAWQKHDCLTWCYLCTPVCSHVLQFPLDLAFLKIGDWPDVWAMFFGKMKISNRKRDEFPYLLWLLLQWLFFLNPIFFHASNIRAAFKIPILFHYTGCFIDIPYWIIVVPKILGINHQGFWTLLIMFAALAPLNDPFCWWNPTLQRRRARAGKMEQPVEPPKEARLWRWINSYSHMSSQT